MGLDEAGQDFQVAAHKLGVELDLVPPGCLAQRNLGLRREGIVLDDAAAPEDVIPQHDPQLGLGVGAMGPQGVEERNLDPRDSVELAEDGLEHQGIGRRPGNVAENDAHPHPRRHDLSQRLQPERRAERLPQGGGGIRQARDIDRFDHSHIERIRQLERQAVFSICQLYRRHDHESAQL